MEGTQEPVVAFADDGLVAIEMQQVAEFLLEDDLLADWRRHAADSRLPDAEFGLAVAPRDALEHLTPRRDHAGQEQAAEGV